MILYLLLGLLSLHQLVFSTEEVSFEKITELSSECEPLITVGNCVNVLTGEFFQVEQDFIGNTIDPIKLIRFYDSKNCCESFLGANTGSQFPLFAAKKTFGEYTYAFINEKEGFFLAYKHHKYFGESFFSEKVYKLDTQVFKKVFTNISKPFLHNQSNPLNRHVTSDKELTLKLGNGARRIYGAQHELSKTVHKEMGMPSRSVHLLTQEIKQNGNRVVYQYDWLNEKPFLKKVQTWSRNGNHLINEINFEHTETNCALTSSCGQCVKYNLKPKQYFAKSHLNSRRILTK